MKKTICYSLALGGLLVLSGCTGKMNQFQADYFSTNPNPLEVSGELVPATVTGNIPAKFFKKNAEVTVIPVLVYNGQEAKSAPVIFQGEKVRGNHPTIGTEGGTMTIPVSYVYNPDMLKSELYLTFNVQQGNKQYVLPRVKVADGVIATASLADVGNVAPALTPDAFQRIINEKYTADIRFLINQANIREGELKSDGMVSFNEQLRNAAGDTTRVIEELNISSYASPEGTLDFNTRLAENREKNTKNYLENQLKKDKIAEFGELTAQFTPEDWEGFQELVSKSNIQDKELILSVLSMYKDPEQREQEIRNLSSVFEVLADEILPQLRRSRLTASVNVIGKSDAEINNYFNTNPSALSVEELLYAATLTDDENRKAQIYQTVTKLYPNDYRGYNNLGMSQFKNKDYAAAAASFNKAASLAPQSREVKMNQGLIAMGNRDYTTANRLFGNAAGLSELNDALGVYYLKSGNVADAAKALAGSKTNNAALAQILNKDYSTAQRTITSIANPDATTYYLAAVLGARTNNSQMVSDNLRKAINLDKTLANKALNDLEFAKFNVSSLLN
ncbi:MAG: tetratricopeptide repeat protein [Muribaculaceae bacterium]|nr:tetratricopeptide repeat protein [Muribaculaceae bacterium]